MDVFNSGNHLVGSLVPPSGDPFFVPRQYRSDSAIQPFARLVECAHPDEQELAVFFRPEGTLDHCNGSGVSFDF